MAEAVCRHPDCAVILDYRNTSGMCRTHNNKAMFRNPEFVARVREGARRKHAEPAFKARCSARLAALHQDPDFAAARKERDRRRRERFKPLMTEAEWADYQTCLKNKYTIAEALTAIGRPELVEART